MARERDDSFRLHKFGGMLPAWSDLLLPDGQASLSTNGYLFSGELESWRKPKLLHTTTLSNPGFVFRIPRTTQARASALLTFLSNPTYGDQITVGEEVYTIAASVGSAYNVLRGATAADTATNLFAALTYDDGAGTNAGTLYGVGTVANPAIDQTLPGTLNSLGLTPTVRITVTAPDYGAAYNSTIVGESTGGVRLAWTYNGNATTTLKGGANIALASDITGDSVYLEFTDPNTDVVRSPVVDDQYDRFYWASSSAPPQYNTRARIEAGLSPWLLGVPAPGCTPGVEVAGGGDSAQLGFPNTISVNAKNFGANTIYLLPITPTGAMQLDSISAVPQATSATAHFAGVLYSDLNGNPHELLNAAVPVQSLTAGSTITSAFTNPTGLLMNERYWIGFMCDEAIDFQKANDTGTSGAYLLNTYANGPPLIINALTVGQPELQMWGEMTTSSILSARGYVYTYLTEYGEESPPSPATVVTGWSNGTWTISLFQPPPDQLGVTRNIKKLRLYRTVTAQTGATVYYFVAEMDVATATYVDTITDDVVVANNQLEAQLYSPPPEGLQGIVAMPNGFLAGWKGNELWFSEQYRPHAWPPSYVLTTEYPIVGIGVTGNTVVCATESAPYVMTGVSPGTMTSVKTQNSEPCHSRRSVVGSNDGVYFCSRNGLVKVDQYGGVTNVTESWMTIEKWQLYTPQDNLCAVILSGMYLAYEVGVNGAEAGLGVDGFAIELGKEDAQGFGVLPQAGGHRIGFQLLRSELTNPLAMIWTDTWSSVVTVVSRNGLYYYDFTDPAPDKTVIDWTSKKYQQRMKKNFEAMRIKFSIPPGLAAQNATRKQDDTDDPSWLAPLPADRYGYILIYADDVLVTARELRKSQEVMRILSGFKYETWHFRIIARVTVQTIQIGTSLKGLSYV